MPLQSVICYLHIAIGFEAIVKSFPHNSSWLSDYLIFIFSSILYML